jgi:hypothetical protein
VTTGRVRRDLRDAGIAHHPVPDQAQPVGSVRQTELVAGNIVSALVCLPGREPLGSLRPLVRRSLRRLLDQLAVDNGPHDLNPERPGRQAHVVAPAQPADFLRPQPEALKRDYRSQQILRGNRVEPGCLLITPQHVFWLGLLRPIDPAARVVLNQPLPADESDGGARPQRVVVPVVGTASGRWHDPAAW